MECNSIVYWWNAVEVVGLSINSLSFLSGYSYRNHPLAQESDVVETLHMRLSLLQMTFGKHIERKHVCFFAGEVCSLLLFCVLVFLTCEQKINVSLYPNFSIRFWTRSSALWGTSVKRQIKPRKGVDNTCSWRMSSSTSRPWPWSISRSTLSPPYRRSPILVLTSSTSHPLLPVMRWWQIKIHSKIFNFFFCF